MMSRAALRGGILDRAICILASITFAVAPIAAQAQQLPTGGSVAAGSVTIAKPVNGTLNVNQSSGRAVINWDSFSVGQGGTVNFNQPGASSATLNRVTGATPSSIAGTINAPGTVLLVNPNGIAISSTGVVNVGSFAASTLDIKDKDFMSGNYKFTGNGASAAVINAGRINVSDGGFAALLGGQVANDGVITARLGRVGLGSGELITLDLSGDGFLSVGVPTSALGKIVGGNGQALVSNKGKIVADGGIVHLSAATAAGILRDAVNVPGSIRANSVGTSNGKIIIGGGAGGRVTVAGNLRASGRNGGNGGTVNVSGAAVAVSGKISANGRKGGAVTIAAEQSVDIWGAVSAKGTKGAGGTIVVTANDIKLAREALLDASGAAGGTVLVGGDYQGGANAANNFVTYPILNAFTTTVAAGAQIKADGSNGAGGRIVVWSDDRTTFAGAVSAQGSGGGQGGFAEVSGHRLLDFTGTANLSAAGGAAGALLLDPRNVTISSGTDSGGSIASGTYTPSADNSILNVTTLQTALSSGNVIVTTGSTGSQSGDITVATPVTWSSHTLTLDAYHSINVNATMSATGSAGLTLKTNDGGSGGSLNFSGGNVTFAGTSQALSINGASYTLLNSMSGVQNINNGLSGNYALANSLNATGVSSWVPVGTDGAGNTLNSGNGFTGKFNGLGNTISNLTINRPSVQNVGLFGAASGGSISSLALSNVNVAGGDRTGALLGYDLGGTTISGVSASGTVSGQYQTGGLIGWFEQGSTLTGGSAAVTVTSPVDDVGGLIGFAAGNVLQSYATGTVTGQYYVGGLVGRANSDSGSVTLQQSFATGAVTGVYYVGGLIGASAGTNQVTVQQSFATGAATGQYYVGGLIGAIYANQTTVQQSYATGSARASAGIAGGLIGTTGKALSISESYATGFVSSPQDVGGLVGYGTVTPTVTSSYWDMATTGQSGAYNGGSLSGASGTTTTVLQAALPAGWSSSVWGIVAGKSYPFFLWRYPAAGGAPQVISGSAYSDGNATAAAGATVSALVNGVSVGSTTAGANGYYNLLVAPNTITANSQVAAYTTGSSGGLSYQQDAPAGSLVQFNVVGTYLQETGAATTLSAMSAGLATAIGSTGVSTSYANRWIVASGASFTIDQAITQSSLLKLSATGNVTQTTGASLNVASLTMQLNAGNPSFTLLDTGNKVTNLAITNLGSGSLSLYDSVSLNVGSPVTANGGVSIQTAGTLTIGNTIASSASGNAIVLVAGSKFINNAGASALSAPNGRWLVYSSSPSSDTFGSLDSGNTAIWNSTYAANVPTTIASGNRYVFAYQPTVTFTSSNASKTYGATADVSANFTVSGINAGVAHAYLADTAAGAYSGTPTLTSAGTAASATVAGGPYLIDVSQGSVTGLNGYAVSFVDSGMLTVNKASLAVTASDASKTYDGLAFSGGNGVTYSGFVNGETSAVLGGTLAYGGTAQGAKSAGSYTLTASGLSSSNYAISYTAGALVINKASLTVTANDAGKTYDGLAFTGGNGVSYGGFVNGETSAVLGGTLAYGGTAQGAKNAGSYMLTASGLTATNYNITYVGGTLTIDRAPLTVTATNFTRGYNGQAFNGYASASSSGFVNGEDGGALSGQLAAGGTAQGAVNAGTYAITLSGLTASNYNITYVPGTLTIQKANLFVTPNNVLKSYDGQAFSGGNGVTYAGFATGETSAVLGGTLTYGGTAQGAVNAGSYTLTASGLTSSNYTINYSAGGLNINKALLTVTANSASKTYDGLAFSGGNGVSYSGFVNGETASVLGGTLTYAGTAQGAKNAGNYSLTASGLTSSNYGIGYVGGALTIGKAALTVTANDAGKTYDGLAFTGGNGVAYSGLVNGETASVLGGTLAYGGTAQGATNAGSYGLTASGLSSSNYAISYAAGALAIGKAALTVTANDAGKTYDGLAFTGGNGVTYSGLVNGEASSVLGGTLSYGGTAQGAKNAGNYSLTASGLTSNNYAISYTGGALTIGKAALTVTVNDAGKTYDGQAFTGGNGVTYSGLVNGETASVLSGTLAYGGNAQGATNAGSYALTTSGLSSNNYAISYTAGALAIGKAALTVAANDASKTYDGLAFTGGNGVTYSGFVNGETSAVLGGTLSYGGTAQGAKNAGSYNLTASGLSSTNYALSYTAGALSIGKAALVVTASDASKTYDGLVYSGGNGASYSGFVNGETSAVLGGTLAYGGTAQGATNAGSYSLTASGLSSNNYTIAYNAGALTIGKAALTVTASDAGKTYDGLAFSGGNGVTYSGFVNGETAAALGGTLAYGGTAQGATNAGSYNLTASGLTATNYAISYTAGALTIGKAALTVAANDAGKTYDGLAFTGGNGVTYSGLVNGETAAVLGGTLAYGGTAQGARNAGSYSLTASGLSSNNYAISYTGGTLNIAKANLTITANDAGKTYGTTLTFNGTEFTTQGLVSGDAVSSVALASTGAASSANVGKYAITAGSASGSGLSNYNVSYVGGTLNVTAATLLVVTANDASKTYGNTLTFNGSEFTTQGLQNGDMVTSVALASTGAAATAAAGQYAITASNAAGSGLSNYSISYVPGTLTVAKANLTITANDAGKTYDGLAFSGGNGVSYSGFVNGESASVLSGTLAYGGTAQGARNAGNYSLTASGLSSNNYAISYTAGALNIGKAALTVAANDAGKTYDGVAFSGGNGVSYSGFVNGETSAVLGGTVAYGGTAQGAKNAGSYSLTASGLTSSNYAISYTAGALSIGKAALTVTANDAGKTYDGVAFSGGNGVSYSGFVNGETSAVLGGTLAYGGTAQGARNAGNYSLTASGLSSNNYVIGYTAGTLSVAKANLTITANDAAKTYGTTLTFNGTEFTTQGLVSGDTVSSVALASTGAASSANIGKYAITAGNAAGSGLSNYNLSYVDGSLNVTTATLLVVTANNASKTYGDRLTFNGSEFTTQGLQNGDTVTSVALASTGAAATANAGIYAITASNATGSGLSNYSISYAPGTLTVAKANLTVAANDAGKTYDGLAFSGGNGVSYSGFVNGETSAVLGGTLAYGGTAQGAKNAGSYNLTASGLSSNNYAISYTAGALSIGKTALIVTANDAGKTYDGVAFSGGNGASYSGFVNGETSAVLGGTLAYGGTAQGAKNAGSYSLTASGLSSNNYAISYTAGALSIGKAALTVAANDTGKTYDGLAFSGGNGVSYTGFVNGETSAVLGGAVAYGGTAQGAKNAGNYSLTASGLTSTNYAISYTAGALNIGKATLTVAANDAGKSYDGLAFAGGNGVSYSGFVNGETSAVLGGTVAYGGTAQGARNAGNYNLTASGLTSNNYAISYTTGALNIGKAALTVTANDAGKTYDGLAFSGGNGVSYTGFVNGETSAVLGGAVAYGGTAQGAKNAGNYSLTAAGLTSNNYSIAYNAGSLSIGKAALMVTASDAAKTYDGQAFSGGNGVSYAGFVNGETSAVVSGTLGYGGSAQGAKNAGSYSLTASGLASNNYAINYTAGALSIGKAALIVTANDAGKTYDGVAFSGGNGAGYSGFVNGETSAVLGGTLAYGGTAQGARNAGNYSLTASGLTSNNYAISYAAGALSVGKATLSYTADAASRTYGDTNPALTGTVTGFVTGETQTSATTGTLAFASSANAASNVGRYAIAGSGLSAVNYTFVQAAPNASALTVTPRSITVTADAKSKQAGEVDPAFTYALSSGNLVGADTLSGVLARVAGENAGKYAILQGSLAASKNYDLSFVGADLSIIAAPGATTNTDPGLAASRYIASGGSTPPTAVNISFQNPTNTAAPVIQAIGGAAPAVRTGAATGSGSTRTAESSPANPERQSTAAALNVDQNIAPGAGPDLVFLPISQFDKVQYSGESLPEFAPKAGEATIATMIARALSSASGTPALEPKVDRLWRNDAAAWTDVAGVSLGNGQGAPADPRGFGFVNGALDVPALLAQGPLILAAAKRADEPAAKLLAIAITTDGKGILANDPGTGQRVILSYDPATRSIGAVTSVIDPRSHKPVALGVDVPDLGPDAIQVPPQSWADLRAFTPASYVGVTIKR
ncbi:hypothetical protein TSA1_15125 [Bradyrhizobium nitroreducens]|uniref:Filamentous haemagglutinin FhaB/tRNA nuclease CdiA-like TPS domain-containing protein n=1 Tax=Bradyrhizobium nitroreducens TaxID=709803 RepID=A0A2M6UBH8_9BRAD|nr:MBG domain-containing protein [Bradyrhizobium nitroreducens]PIT01956.1 hypothetical protein TSA1_15125 [Bradyrhizobium nitroreducens]